jgi:hypothetical protein
MTRIHAPIEKSETFTDTIIDDNNESFPVEITVDYTMDRHNNKDITGYDFKVNGSPVCSSVEIRSQVLDAIWNTFKINAQYV